MERPIITRKFSTKRAGSLRHQHCHRHEWVTGLWEIRCHLGKPKRAGAQFASARRISAEPEDGDLRMAPLGSDLHSLTSPPLALINERKVLHNKLEYIILPLQHCILKKLQLKQDVQGRKDWGSCRLQLTEYDFWVCNYFRRFNYVSSWNYWFQNVNPFWTWLSSFKPSLG